MTQRRAGMSMAGASKRQDLYGEPNNFSDNSHLPSMEIAQIDLRDVLPKPKSLPYAYSNVRSNFYHQNVRLEDIKSIEDIETLSISQLVNILQSNLIKIALGAEKVHLIDQVRQLFQAEAAQKQQNCEENENLMNNQTTEDRSQKVSNRKCLNVECPNKDKFYNPIRFKCHPSYICSDCVIKYRSCKFIKINI